MSSRGTRGDAPVQEPVDAAFDVRALRARDRSEQAAEEAKQTTGLLV